MLGLVFQHSSDFLGSKEKHYEMLLGIIFSMYSWEGNYNNESGSFIITMMMCLYITSLKTIRLIPYVKDLGLSDSPCHSVK